MPQQIMARLQPSPLLIAIMHNLQYKDSPPLPSHSSDLFLLSVHFRSPIRSAAHPDICQAHSRSHLLNMDTTNTTGSAPAYSTSEEPLGEVSGYGGSQEICDLDGSGGGKENEYPEEEASEEQSAN